MDERNDLNEKIVNMEKCSCGAADQQLYARLDDEGEVYWSVICWNCGWETHVFSAMAEQAIAAWNAMNEPTEEE